MEHNLLLSLRKYLPNKDIDPLENFITEAFAWMLKSYDDFALFFMDKILSKIGISVEEIIEFQCSR